MHAGQSWTPFGLYSLTGRKSRPRIPIRTLDTARVGKLLVAVINQRPKMDRWRTGAGEKAWSWEVAECVITVIANGKDLTLLIWSETQRAEIRYDNGSLVFCLIKEQEVDIESLNEPAISRHFPLFADTLMG